MTISNFELQKIASENNIQLNSIMMNNEINKRIMTMKSFSGIINLNNIGEQGSHWVAMIKRGNIILYFDSFGAIPIKSIVKNKGKNKLAYSNYIVQDLDSTQRGLFCIAFLHYIQYNKGNLADIYNDFINLFEHDTTLNDKILFEYLNDNFKKH